MNIDYKEELNESQYEAVVYDAGPSLVIAGAGSGKTRVLTYKIAYLLEHGYEPWSILALTFTNKAAREMKERITQKMQVEGAKHLWMGTFHSIFSRILRMEAQCLGFTSNFTIYDSADSKSLIRSIIKEMQLDEKTYKPGTVQARISNAKNHLVTPELYAANKEVYSSDMMAKMPAIRDIYARYWERCRQSGAMDFDDLLLYTYLLFRDHPQVLAFYQERFKYVLVDEYQDTNFAQHSIVLQLTKLHQRVCVVGDDAQSIYSFRGANIDNILYFTQIYPQTKLFKLEQNYRSTRSIVSAANSLIKKNTRQIPKDVFSEKEVGDQIEVFQAYSDVEEGEMVANKILELRRKKGCAYMDFAILYRTNAQSRVFEESFRKRNIPYKIYGGLSFYQRKEIKDVVAYFRMVVNPHDEEAFKRIINYPARGIGDTTLKKIATAAMEGGVSYWSVLCEPLAYNLSINKGTHAKLQGFRELVEELTAAQAEMTLFELGQHIIRRSGIYNDILQDTSPESLSRKENIEELLNGMSDFYASRREEGVTELGLGDFLSEISLLTDQDNEGEADVQKVTLMTVHSAKGLEFPNVFVVGMEEELFPSSMTGESAYALEEERRLFYVALTRAEERCFLSYARSRFKYGKTEFCNPSRFLRDIDARYLNLPHEVRMRTNVSPSSSYSSSKPVQPKQVVIPPPTPTRQLKRVGSIPSHSVSATKSSAATIGEVAVGRTIEHERFGLGEVIRLEGTGENAKATIRFRNAGEKQLLLRFARFKVLD